MTAREKQVRERCEKLVLATIPTSIACGKVAWVNALESFAREIRNEALDEAAEEAVLMCSENHAKRGAAFGHEIADNIRALKDSR